MKDRNTLKNLLLPVILFLGLTFIAAKINQTGIPALVDDGSGATVGISYAHHEIHDGSHYFGKTFVTFTGAANDTQYFMFLSPDTDTEIHAKFKYNASAEFQVYILEGVTTSADGTPFQTFNNNRAVGTGTISDGAELLAYAGPTITDEGTTIWSSVTGEGKSPIGVAPEMGYEIIAKRNTKYAFKIIKIPVQQPEWVDIDFWWYENSH